MLSVVSVYYDNYGNSDWDRASECAARKHDIVIFPASMDNEVLGNLVDAARSWSLKVKLVRGAKKHLELQSCKDDACRSKMGVKLGATGILSGTLVVNDDHLEAQLVLRSTCNPQWHTTLYTAVGEPEPMSDFNIADTARRWAEWIHNWTPYTKKLAPLVESSVKDSEGTEAYRNAYVAHLDPTWKAAMSRCYKRDDRQAVIQLLFVIDAEGKVTKIESKGTKRMENCVVAHLRKAKIAPGPKPPTAPFHHRHVIHVPR